MEENSRCKKRFTNGENGQLRVFFIFFIVLTNVDFNTSAGNKFIPIIEKRRKKLKCLVFCFRYNDKIRLFCSPKLCYITLLSL